MASLPTTLLGTGISPQDYSYPTFVDISQTFASIYHSSDHLDSPYISELRNLFIPPKSERTAKYTFLFIFADAYGLNHLDTIGDSSFMKQYYKRTTRAVFPSSTPCCMTSFFTGVYPCDHGCIGRTYLRESKVILQPLQMTEFKTQTPVSV